MATKKEKRNSRSIQKRALSDLFTSEMEAEIGIKQNKTKETETNADESATDPLREVTEEKLQLVPGETLIGTRTGKINSEFKELDIYYGNYVLPLIQDKFRVLKKDEYLRMLNSFLDSEEGQIYERPTEKQIEQMTKYEERYGSGEQSP